MGTGINLLTDTPYVVYYDLDWDLSNYYQSLDRNYRIGTKEKVFVYRLLTTFGADNLLAETLDLKKDVADTVIEKINCLLCEGGDSCGHVPFEHGCVLKRSIKWRKSKLSSLGKK